MVEPRAARPHPDPGEGAPRRRSWTGAGIVGPAVCGLVVVSATTVVALADPREVSWYPTCPLLALTGFACPWCGALRATHDLAHLDLAAAWSSNPWWVAVAALCVATWGVRAFRTLRPAGPQRTATRARVVLAVLATGAVFGVLRNVPGLAALLGPG